MTVTITLRGIDAGNGNLRTVSYETTKATVDQAIDPREVLLYLYQHAEAALSRKDFDPEPRKVTLPAPVRPPSVIERIFREQDALREREALYREHQRESYRQSIPCMASRELSRSAPRGSSTPPGWHPPIGWMGPKPPALCSDYKILQNFPIFYAWRIHP